MDFKILSARFRQFGGFKLIVEYAKIGALWPGVKAGLKCLIKGQSYKGIYPEVLKCVEPILVAKYSHIVKEFNSSRNLSLEHKSSKIVWYCWLQGLDKAPEIVRACYNSLRQNLTDREIRVIENENWKEYVELPIHIVEKWEKKQMPAALFSDLLRLELLIKYGGAWIDSTVLGTGFKFQYSGSKWQEYLDADLFLFQYTKQGDIPVKISNWFITASSNNEVLMVLREMLYAYWKDYDCTLDYYIFHLFFTLISKGYPEQMAAMPYARSQNSLVLLHHWGERFDQRIWDKLTSQVCFHKLAFRVDEDTKKNPNNYYNHILQVYGRI